MADKTTYLMSAIGIALHAWSQVESGMSQMFCNLGGTSLEKAEAIFDTVISFETRVAILDAVIAVEPLLSEEEKLIWASLSSRLRKLYKKRHEIAHFGIASTEDLVNGTRIAPFFTWGKARTKSNKYLSHDQIIVRAGTFTKACEAVGWFTAIMMQRKLPLVFDASPPREPDLIVRIRELLAHTKEEQSRQPGLELE